MSANPEPNDGVTLHNTDGAEIIRDSGGPERIYFFELEGWMPWILNPETILLEGSPADFHRKLPMEIPEFTGRATFHQEEMAAFAQNGTQRAPRERDNPICRTSHHPQSADPTRPQTGL